MGSKELDWGAPEKVEEDGWRGFASRAARFAGKIGERMSDLQTAGRANRRHFRNYLSPFLFCKIEGEKKTKRANRENKRN